MPLKQMKQKLATNFCITIKSRKMMTLPTEVRQTSLPCNMVAKYVNGYKLSKIISYIFFSVTNALLDVVVKWNRFILGDKYRCKR